MREGAIASLSRSKSVEEEGYFRATSPSRTSSKNTSNEMKWATISTLVDGTILFRPSSELVQRMEIAGTNDFKIPRSLCWNQTTSQPTLIKGNGRATSPVAWYALIVLQETIFLTGFRRVSQVLDTVQSFKSIHQFNQFHHICLENKRTFISICCFRKGL